MSLGRVLNSSFRDRKVEEQKRPLFWVSEDRRWGGEGIYSWQRLLAFPCPLELFIIFRAAKNRKTLFPKQEKKQDKVVRRAVSCCTSMILVGIFMSMTDKHLSEFSSMPFFINMNSRIFLAYTPTYHLTGFKRMLYFLIGFRTPFKSASWLCPSVIIGIMS